MKKVFASFIAIMFLSCSSFAKTITIVKTNGGALGYDRVDESHTEGDNHGLSCLAPGQMACEFTLKPRIIASSGVEYNLEDIQQDVEALISQGESSGSYYLENEFISWNGSDNYNYELTITDNQ